MAAGIFNPENDFWRLIEKLVDLFLLSVFWLVCSLSMNSAAFRLLYKQR